VDLPGTARAYAEGADIASDSLGHSIRELADRLVEEAARAAEYRLRLELTEQAQSTLEAELAAERLRREQAESERDALSAKLTELGASPEPLESSVSTSEERAGTDIPSEEQSQERRPSWWRRFFGFENPT
jgi:chromosome segregation ATPase